MHVPLCLTVWGSLEIEFLSVFLFFGSSHNERSDQWCHWENAQTPSKVLAFMRFADTST